MSSKEQEHGRLQNSLITPWWRSQHPFKCFPISSGDEQKRPQHWGDVREQSAMAGYSQQMIFAKYPYLDHCYGLFSTYAPQLMGRIMLPMSMKRDEGAIYVNAKQYNGIIRRRKSRAKAELHNNAMKARQPYLHESRHLHAKRRARGSGGRFLGTKGSDTTKSRVSKRNSNNEQAVVYSSASMNSGSKDTIRCNSTLTVSGSEVTSTYPRGYFDLFQINGHHPPMCSLADSMDGVDSMMMPLKWHPVAGTCCNNLKV